MDGSLPSFEDRMRLHPLDARARRSNHRARRPPERRELSLPRAARRVRSSQRLELRRDAATARTGSTGSAASTSARRARRCASAHALEKLPHVSAAMERGELSYSKVRAITRVQRRERSTTSCRSRFTALRITSRRWCAPIGARGSAGTLARASAAAASRSALPLGRRWLARPQSAAAGGRRRAGAEGDGRRGPRDSVAGVDADVPRLRHATQIARAGRTSAPMRWR